MNLESGALPRFLWALKPPLPTMWVAGSTSVMAIPRESYTLGRTRHALSIGTAMLVIFAPSLPRIRRNPPEPSDRLMLFSVLPRVPLPDEAQAARTRMGSARRNRIGFEGGGHTTIPRGAPYVQRQPGRILRSEVELSCEGQEHCIQ